jgi:glycine/D-amino acid oxidase-like deaminating enzyme
MTDKIKPDRRTVLTGGLGLASAVAALPATKALAQVSARPGAPAISRNLPDVAVVGAGAFGAWTALCLREKGARVTLIDQYAPGNPRSASGGETRNIRGSYGDREIYTRWAHEAWKMWHDRQEEFGRRLIYPNTSLRALHPAMMDAQIPIFKKMGLPFEELSGEETVRRWPQYKFAPEERVFWEKESGSVKARESLIAASEVFMQKGGQYRVGKATPGAMTGGRMNSITVDGQSLSAGVTVFACGPWLGQVFPSLAQYFSAARGEMWWIGSPPGDERYRWENAPNITDQVVYTSADNGGGYKIAARGPRVEVKNPDTIDRTPTEALRKGVLEYVAERLPGLVGQPVIQTHVCQDGGPASGHFMIDTHPDASNVWVVGGGSGHAFKMGPKSGQYISGCVLGTAQPAEEAKVFKIAAHTRQGARAAAG